MKEIQGRIKFGVVQISNQFKMARITSTNELRIKNGISWVGVCGVGSYSTIVGKLSDITDEQAAEFVESDEKLNDEYFGDVCGYVNYCSSQNNWHPLSSVKESLISLLKANGIKCKLTEKEPEAMLLYNIQRFECTADEMWRCREYKELPDDLLLIKL